MVDQSLFDLAVKSLYAFTFFISFLYSLTLDISNTVTKLTFKSSNVIVSIVLIIYCFLVGLRDLTIGSDTLSYFGIWQNVNNFEFEGEYVFGALMFVLKNSGFSFSFFLFIIVLMFSVYVYKSFKLLGYTFGINPFLLLFSFISFFFFESITINVIRQGLALSFLLYSWTLYVTHSRKKYYIFYLFLAVLTHTTSIIPIVLFILISKFGHKVQIRYYLILYILGVFLAVINYGVLNIAPFLQDVMGDSRRVSYFTDDNDLYTVGFKPQFVVFNTLFLLVGYFLTKRCILENWYIILLKYFIVSSFIFFMWFQIPYSDRIGLYCWIVIPMLLAPFFNYKKDRFKLTTLVCVSLLVIYLFFKMYF
ncbi:EpsG family protein [Myroides odoratimimus]|uniref:EpsG family protein n=1 Tax=Myroides odoratimimus TaxID=76832 RepID=UPI001CE17DE5|nr:EpsG family protein [Myroides odoratimimus]MCA4806985.1 EpsG family protein [Myroides odoratimimus]